MVIYRLYQLCIAAPIMLVSTLLCAVCTIVGCTLGGARIWGYYPGKIWSKIMCRALLLPVKVEGREKLDHKASYVFVCNHQGAMDIFLVYGYLGHNFKWMMKQSLRNIPLVGYACYKAKFIFVDRGNKHSIKKSISRAGAILHTGMSLVVFPEGTRTYTGKMGRFNRGAFFLADELQLSVVPITIDGSFDVLPRTKGLNFVRHRRMRMVIHDAIPPQGRGADNMKALSKLSFDAINSALPEEHKIPKNDD